MLVAVNRPPLAGLIMMRPSPDLLSLMDATSNSGRGAAAGWAQMWQAASRNPATAVPRSIAIRFPFRIPRSFSTMMSEGKRRIGTVLLALRRASVCISGTHVCIRPLVFRRPLYVIDDQDFNGAFARFQLQAELLLKSRRS